MAEQMALDGNYSSLADDEDADDVMAEIIAPHKGWVRAFKSEQEVINYLGATPVVSPLGLVTKHRKHPAGKVVATNA